MKRASRRRFLRLVLVGGAAVVGGAVNPILRPARAASPATAPRRRRRPRGSSASFPSSMRREIANQKRYVARALKTIRNYQLAPGSDMAFVFRPLSPQGKGRPGAR